MFYCPFASMDGQYRDEPMTSYIRILHASPDSPNVDVFANNKRIVKDLSYKQFTEYLPLPSGSYVIKIYPAGTKTNPVLSTTLGISPKSVNTVAVTGLLPGISLFTIPEPPVSQVTGRACIRFVHLSPDSAALDLTTPNGDKIFANVGYKGVTGYSCVPSGRHSIQVRTAGTNRVLINDPYLRLLPNRYYTIYTVGTSGGTVPLQILIALDGRSYITI